MITKEGSVVPSLVPGSNVVSNITVELVKKGFIYTVQTVIEGIDVEDVVDFYLDPQLFTGKFAVVYEISYTVSQGKGIAQFFTGGDYSHGTPLIVLNRNENSSNTPETIISVNPTITTLGTGSFKYLAGSETQGNNIGGGGNKGDSNFPIEINKNVDRIFRVSQTGGSGTFCLEFRLIFAEIL